MAQTLGLNIVFPIYKDVNGTKTPFHDLVLRKAVVNSVVMSLGDKITGDVYYKNNTLDVSMQEYIEFQPNDDEQIVKYILVNPPTVVREGMVSDNSDLKGMTKYSFEFYHPMCLLANLPFSDIAVNSSEEIYLSQNKTFNWIGKPMDFIAKLNKNLESTQWVVAESDRFPEDKNDELSDVLSFDNNTIADALKTCYETWEVPYVISQLPTTDSRYASGKRFLIEFGLPSNEIYATDNDRINETPFVFRFGKGVGLKNNSRSPRNNKIITRISGYGSENNIPYGYPQIEWEGDSRWDYTAYQNPNNIQYDDNGKVTNSPAVGAYPLYMGIVGGAYVKLIKHPFTRTHLMPSIYRETVNNRVNPFADNYDPTAEIKDYYDAIATQEYPYVNEIVPNSPCYEIHEFEDIKPEMDDGTNYVEIVDAVPLNKDLTPADSWDDSIDDDGNYNQSYFKITLPILSFDLYACAAITEEMQINMRSGACIGCTFTIQCDWDNYKLNFYDEDGNFAPDGEQRDLTKYPKSDEQSIDVIVQKDLNTFGTIMPNMYQYPEDGDEFVILGISLPNEYIESAEERLDDAMKSYMLENNIYYYDYPIKFDEYFLANNTNILKQIRTNSIIRFEYGSEEIELYVKELTIKYGDSPLPQYDITLTDDIEVSLNQLGQVAEDIEHLSSIISILRQSYSRNVWNELAKKLSKAENDSARGVITFLQGLLLGGGSYGIDENGEGILNSLAGRSYTGSDIIADKGFKIWEDENGYGHLDIDYLTARVKAYFAQLEIRKVTFTQGDLFFSKAGSKIVAVMPVDAEGNVLTPTQGMLRLFSSNGMFFSAASGWYAIETTDAYSDEEFRAMIHSFRCYELSDDGTTATINLWEEGDMARCQTMNIKAGKYTGVSNRYYGRLVVGKGTQTLQDGLDYNYVDLYVGWDEPDARGLTLVYEDYDTTRQIYPYGYDPSDPHSNPYFMGMSNVMPDGFLANDIPAVGDDIAQVGNQSDADRMNLIQLALSDGGSMNIYSGVNDWDLSSHRVVKMSPSGVELEARYFLLKSNSGAGDPVPVTVFRGEWSSATTYGYYDEVTYNGSLYVWNNPSANSTSADVPGVSQYWLLAVSKGDTGDLPKDAEIRADSSSISISADNDARISDLSGVYGLPSEFAVYWGDVVVPTANISYINVNGLVIKGSGTSELRALQPKSGRYAINQNNVTISQWELKNTGFLPTVLAPTQPLSINATFTADGSTHNVQVLIPITVTKAGDPAVSVTLDPPVIILDEKVNNSNNAYISYIGASTNIKVIKGSEEVSVFSASVDSASSNIDTTKINISNGVVTVEEDAITSSTTTNEFLVLLVTVGGAQYEVNLSIFINRLGSWSLTVAHDVLESVSSKIVYMDINGDGQLEPVELETAFEQSSSVASLTAFKNGVAQAGITVGVDGYVTLDGHTVVNDSFKVKGNYFLNFTLLDDNHFVNTDYAEIVNNVYVIKLSKTGNNIQLGAFGYNYFTDVTQQTDIYLPNITSDMVGMVVTILNTLTVRGEARGVPVHGATLYDRGSLVSYYAIQPYSLGTFLACEVGGQYYWIVM